MEKRKNPDQFQLRMPPGLRADVKALAKANQRTMSGEIVFHLERVVAEMRTQAREAADAR